MTEGSNKDVYAVRLRSSPSSLVPVNVSVDGTFAGTNVSQLHFSNVTWRGPPDGAVASLSAGVQVTGWQRAGGLWMAAVPLAAAKVVASPNAKHGQARDTLSNSRWHAWILVLQHLR